MGIQYAFLWHYKDPYEEMAVSELPLTIVQNTLKRAKIRHLKEAYILQERQKQFNLPQPDKLPCIAIDSPSKEYYRPYDEASINKALHHYQQRIIKERQELGKDTTSKIAISPYFVPQSYLDSMGISDNAKHIYRQPLPTYYVRNDSPDTEVYTIDHMDFITRIIDTTHDLLHNYAVDADMVEPEAEISEGFTKTTIHTETVEKTELPDEEHLVFLSLYKYFLSLIHEQQSKEKPEPIPTDITVPLLEVTPYRKIGKNLTENSLIKRKNKLTKKKEKTKKKKKEKLYDEDIEILREYYGDKHPEVRKYIVDTPRQWEEKQTVSKVIRLKVMQKLATVGLDILINIKLANYPYTMKNAYNSCFLRLKKYEERNDPNKVKKSQSRYSKKNDTTNNNDI